MVGVCVLVTLLRPVKMTELIVRSTDSCCIRWGPDLSQKGKVCGILVHCQMVVCVCVQWELWRLISPVREEYIASFRGGRGIGQCNIMYRTHVALRCGCSIPMAE